MQSKKMVLTFAILAMLLATLITVPVTVAKKKSAPGPYLDEFWIDFITEYLTQKAAFIAGDIDLIYVIKDPDIDALKKENIGGTGKGATIEITTSWWPCWIGCNARPEATPVNESLFRKALYHMFPKVELVSTYLGRLAVPIDVLMPQSQGPWYDPTVVTPWYDPGLANYTLDQAGYIYNSTYGCRQYPNGTRLPPIRVMDPTYSETDHEFQQRWIREMRACGLDAVADVVATPTDFLIRWFYIGDYMCCPPILWGGVPGPWGMWYYRPSGPWNVWGYINPELDDLLDTSWTTTNMTLAIETAKAAQRIFLEEAYLMLPIYTPNIVVAYNPGIMGIYNEPDPFGFIKQESVWQWRDLYPEGGGMIRLGTTGEGLSLNPGYWGWLGGYGYTVVLAVSSRLLDMYYDPETYDYIFTPWIAYNWTVDPWIHDNQTGTNTTFWLRDNVYMHDGVQFTAEDVAFSLKYARDKGIEFMPLYVYDVQVHNPYKCSVLCTKPGLYTLLWMIRYACLFPKHVWNDNVTRYGSPAGFSGIQSPYEYGVGNPTDAEFKPWLITNPLNSSLTCLIGAGAYYFPNDGLTDLGPEGQMHMVAYRNHFNTQMISDPNADFVVNVLDLIFVATAFGQKYGDPKYSLTRDMNDDLAINILDLILVAVDFGLTW